jgi:hypothetical protein
MSDFFPPITTIYEWNGALEDCANCCPMPVCEEPVLDCQKQKLRLCAHYDVVPIADGSDSDSESDNCFRYYRSHKLGDSVSGSYTLYAPGGGPLRESWVANWDNYTVTTFASMWTPDLYDGPTGYAPPCDAEVTCTATGSYTYRKYIGEVISIVGEVYTYGPNYILDEVDATLSNMAGMPDPRWEPDSDESEGDRPILPGPCFPMWTYIQKTYTPEYDSDHPFGLIGTNLTSTVTIYDTSSPSLTGYYNSDGSDSDSDPDPSYTSIPYNDFSGEITCAEMLAELSNAPETWPTDEADSDSAEIYTWSDCGAEFDCTDCVSGPIARRFRYRWKIPPCHPGSWYKIEWDEVFFPKAYLDWLAAAQAYDPNDSIGSDSLATGIEPFDPNANPPPELPVLTPKEWTWEGDALGPCLDVDSTPSDSSDAIANDLAEREAMTDRWSPWSLTVVPPGPGTVELRNARIQCYRNPFGTVTQPIVIGDFTLGDLDQDGIDDSSEPISDIYA